jgi:CoA:oxalate CoA-transferase
MNNDRESHGALSGLRVLDLTQFLSGPFCTMILGDLGADVIKVEPPEGDLTRKLPPYFVGDDSAYYLHVNRNKRAIVLDLKQAAATDILTQLVRQSDVLVENFRPGVLEKLGLPYTLAEQLNPKIIWCSISGFGQDGPYRDRPTYDMVVQALSGAMSLTGEPDGRSVRLGVPIGDLSAGMYGVIGILAALHECEQSGHGQRIDVAMLDSLVSLLSYQGAYALFSGKAPMRQGRGHDSIPTYRTFRCRDGRDVAVTANTERMWVGLCHALEVPELTGDPRFLTNRERWTNREELWPLLDERFMTVSATDAAERLRAQSVPAAVINDVLDALDDEQVRARSMVVGLEADDGRTIDVLGNPIRLERSSHRTASFPPALGEHTESLLVDVLGMSHEAIEAAAAAGAFGAASTSSRSAAV